MKKPLFLIALCLLLAGVNAETGLENEAFCAPSVPVSNQPFFLVSWEDDCVCCIQDYVENEVTGEPELTCKAYEPRTTDWRDVMCVGGGDLLQQRTVTQLVKPLCIEETPYFEEQTVYFELCKSCPEPTVLGQWEEVACVNGHPLLQQRIEGYKFDSGVENCVPVNDVRIKVDSTSQCNVVTYVTSFYWGWYLIIPTALVLLLLFWKRKEVKKWVRKR